MAKITVTRSEKEDKKSSPEEEALVSQKLEEIRREVWWVSTFLVKIPLILGGLFLIFFILLLSFLTALLVSSRTRAS